MADERLARYNELDRSGDLMSAAEDVMGVDHTMADIINLHDNLIDIDKMTIEQLHAHRQQLRRTTTYLHTVAAALGTLANTSSSLSPKAKAPTPSDRLRGLWAKPPLRLLLFLNGHAPDTCDEKVLCFDTAKLPSVLSKEERLNVLLEQCTETLNMPTHGRRLFFQDGVEVTSIDMIQLKVRNVKV